MKGFTDRPGLLIGSATWFGTCCAATAGISIYIPLALLCASLALVLIFTDKAMCKVSLVIAFFAMGILRSPESVWNGPPSLPAAFLDTPAEIRVRPRPGIKRYDGTVPGTVEEVRVGYLQIRGAHVALEGISLDGKVNPSSIDVVGSVYLPSPALNPGCFDRRNYYRRLGFACAIKVKNPEAVEKSFGPSRLGTICHKIMSIIEDSNPEVSGILNALLMGNRSSLSSDVAEAMKRAGIYHVLAISGLHVGIAVLLITIVVRLTGVPRGLRIFFEVTLALAYVVFTGSRPSAQRAFVFFALLGLSRLLQVKIDLSNAIGVTVTFLLLLQPWLAWDIGFELSVGAAIGITVLLPSFSHKANPSQGLSSRLLRYLFLCSMASLTAQTFTLPILAYHFGRISPMGLLLNPIALPLVTLIVAGGLQGCIASLFSPSLAKVFFKGSSLFSSLLISIATHASSALDMTIVVGRPSVIRIILCCFLIVLIMSLSHFRRLLKMGLIGLVWVTIIFPNPFKEESDLEISFLYVGHGDAFVVNSGGQTLLVDSGPSHEDWDAGSAYVAPFLYLKGVRKLDRVVITHPHSDHYGGLRGLIGRFDIGEIIVSTCDGEGAYSDIIRSARSKGIQVRRVEQGDTLIVGNARIRVLSPNDLWIRECDDVNATSLVLEVTCGKFKALLTGDVPCWLQEKLSRNQPDLRATLLKIPHHGRPNALAKPFLEKVRPAIGIVSGAPPAGSHARAISDLESTGVEVLKTYEDGAIDVKVKGEQVSISCFRSKRNFIFSLDHEGFPNGLDSL